MTYPEKYILKAESVLRKDKVISDLLDRFDFPAPSGGNDLFSDLVRSIAGQQLSVKAAQTIYGRFLALLDHDLRPSTVLNLTVEDLRTAGLSNQKANYIMQVAAYFQGPDAKNMDWWAMSDEEIEGQLIQIKGVGKWTVQMILLFTFDRPDVFPLSDLGIRMGMKKLYGLESEGKELERELMALAAQWKPYRSYGSKLIWKGKDFE